jgi:hypothetical protein
MIKINYKLYILSIINLTREQLDEKLSIGTKFHRVRKTSFSLAASIKHIEFQIKLVVSKRVKI